MNLQAEVLRDDVLGEEIHRYRLDSGLRVLVHLKPGFQRKFAVLGTNFGSVDQRFVDRSTGELVQMPDGVAHFLEHMLFECEGSSAFEDFSRRGANANAATSFRSTAFFFGCSDQLLPNLRTLLRMVRDVEFSEEAVAKEKAVITQEILMYEDSADWQGLNQLVRGLFVRHPVRNDIAGSVESVKRIDVQALRTCHANFYDPGNLCLVVTGDVDPEAVAEAAWREMGGAEARRPVLPVRVREPLKVAQRRVESSHPAQRPKLYLGFKDSAVPVEGEVMQRRNLVTSVLLGLMFGGSSRTWQKLYEEGTIDDTFHASYGGEEDFGFVTLCAETEDPERLRRVLLREVRSFLRQAIDTEDFGRVIHNMLGRFVRGLDSQEGTCFVLMGGEFTETDLFRFPAMVRMITPDDVLARHRELFRERNHCTSVVTPLRKG